MVRSLCSLLVLVAGTANVQDLSLEEDLQPRWMKYEAGRYEMIGDADEVANTVYFQVVTSRDPGRYLLLSSSRPYFVFFDGELVGEFAGSKSFRIDSLHAARPVRTMIVSLYQRNINPRDLTTQIVSSAPGVIDDISRPDTFFKDFVILAGLLIMVLCVATLRLNPKLAADYFALRRIFSTREVDDAQSNARLTNGANVQFYVLCSLLIGFYLLIIFQYLPSPYRAPMDFVATGFWSAFWHWMRLSVFILAIFFLKLLLIFSLTRLFDMRGLTRVHFFNWVRLMLIVLGLCAAILFAYFILRGDDPDVYEVFLTLVIGILVAWHFIVFLKLNGRSEHSMFHLFSYICATELIPLLITIKVLFH